MSYLLDTCVLSDFAKGERGTIARLHALHSSHVAISAISVLEVEYGLAREKAKARKWAPAMRALLEAVKVLPIAAEDARAIASLRAALERQGKPIGAYDVLIAGSALARGLVLVTANSREFERVSGLRVENWRLAREA